MPLHGATLLRATLLDAEPDVGGGWGWGGGGERGGGGGAYYYSHITHKWRTTHFVNYW